MCDFCCRLACNAAQHFHPDRYLAVKTIGINPFVKPMGTFTFADNAPKSAKAVNRKALGAQKGSVGGARRLKGNNRRIFEPRRYRRLIGLKHVLPDR